MSDETPFMPPVARTDDPTTSKQAAASVNRKGQMLVLLRTYADFPEGLTDHEAGHLSGLGDEAGHKRGSDLRNAEWIEVVRHEGRNVTRVGPSGRACRVCRITGEGKAALA